MGLMHSFARFWADTSGSVLSLSLTLMGGQPGGSSQPPIDPGDALLLENGDFLLLENGDKLLLEA